MSKESPFGRIAILGVGLIGGSLGLAFKKRFSNVHIRGLGRDRARLETAKKRGAIDDLATDLSKGFKGCDLVILATPVEHILQALESLGNHLDPETVVTGREVTGVENSLPELFQDAPYVLCPLPGARSGNLQKLLRLVEGIGASPTVMSAEEHDQIISWTSHLPQLISTALANVYQGQETQDNKLIRASGSGFRDMIRLAGSPYLVWRGILETNDDNIDQTLEAFIRKLEKMRSDLKERRLSHDFERAVEFYNTYRAIKSQHKKP